MRVIRFDDREEFARRVRPFLMRAEAENCFFLGMIGGEDIAPGVLMLALLDDAGAVVGVAMKWPERHVVLTDAPPAAVDALVDYLIDAGLPVQGAQSRGHVTRRFIDRYSSRTGVRPGAPTSLAVHLLTQVNPVSAVDGTLRLATMAEADFLASWIEAFCRDCNLPPPRDGEGTRARQRIERGEAFFWEIDGVAVSTASLSGPTPNGVRISLVYTPSDLRGRGYASACVAALSRRMLDSGRRFCFLYTDLANPTSNKIYRAIGYEPVCDNLQVLFEVNSER